MTTGLEVIMAEVNSLLAGICPACGHDLPPVSERTRLATCDDVCHAVWIERIVARHGETRNVTHIETGKVYLVPTRVILEQGINLRDLSRFPEKTR